MSKIDRQPSAEFYGLKVGDMIASGRSSDAFITSIKRAKPRTILTFQVRISRGLETVHISVNAGPGALFANDIIQSD